MESNIEFIHAVSGLSDTEPTTETDIETTIEKRKKPSRYYDYLPTLNDIADNEDAKRAVQVMSEINKNLMAEIENTRNKLNIWPSFNTKLNQEHSKPVDKFSFATELGQIKQLTNLTQAENPLQEIVRFNFTPEQISLCGNRISTAKKIHNKLFSPGSRLLHKFWQGADFQETVTNANQLAGEIAMLVERNIIYSIRNSIETSHQQLPSLRERIAAASRNFGSSNPEQIIKNKQELDEALVQFSAEKKAVSNLDDLFARLQATTIPSREDDEALTSLALEGLQSRIQQYKNDFAIEEQTINGYLGNNNIASHLSVKLDRMRYDKTNAELQNHGNNITKELLLAVQRYNELIQTEVNKLLNRNTDQHLMWPPTGYGNEAEEISSARLLTHGGPTKVMYQILERGELASVAEQKKSHGQTVRTHTIDRLRDKELILETHSLCFDDRGVVYGIGSRHDICFLFSENQMFSGGKQFADSDGRHIFDARFESDPSDDLKRDQSPGLKVKLNENPFMVAVTNQEKAKFLNFLKTKSAWHDELSAMPEVQFDEWVDKHVIFVDDLNQFKVNAELQKSFAQKHGIEIKKGFVQETNHPISKHYPDQKTHRFTPFAQQN